MMNDELRLGCGGQKGGWTGVAGDNDDRVDGAIEKAQTVNG
ncbi:hypothetical protein [Dyadobacter sp. 32]